MIKNTKRSFLICLACVIMLKSQANTKSTTLNIPYSEEQITLIKNAFDHPDFLIGDQLKYLNPKNFISTQLNILQLNIYLSSLNTCSFKLENKGFTIQNSANRDNQQFLANYHIIEGINYSFQGAISSAIASFEKALIACYALKDYKKLTLISTNLSSLYLLKKDVLSAEKKNNIALIYYRQLNTNSAIINCILIKAQIALYKGEFKKAENFILKNALLLSSQIESKKGEQQCYFELGKIYMKSKRFTEAKWFFIQSLTLADKLNLRLAKIKSLLLLAKIQNLNKDYTLALKDLLLVKKMSDNYTNVYQSDLQLELAKTYSYLHAEAKMDRSLLSFKTLKNNYLIHKI